MTWSASRIPGARLLAVLVCAGLLAACTGRTSQTTAVGAGAETEGASLALGDGERPAPGFQLEDLEGELVRLDDSAGTVRLLDFWATWCAPCREEVPMLNELHAAYADRGLTILAISDEDSDTLRKFVDDNDVIYRNLVGTDDVNASYGVLGLPTAYLVDRDGKIVDSFLGPKPKAVLDKKIRALLEG